MDENIRTDSAQNSPKAVRSGNKNIEYDAIESGVWAKNILPILNNLKAQCEIHHIPFAADFAVANKDGHTKYHHDGVFPDADGSGLYENNFGKYLLALQGGYVSPYDPGHSLNEALDAYNSMDDDAEDE